MKSFGTKKKMVIPYHIVKRMIGIVVMNRAAWDERRFRWILCTLERIFVVMLRLSMRLYVVCNWEIHVLIDIFFLCVFVSIYFLCL